MLRHSLVLRNDSSILASPDASKWAKHGFDGGWVDMYYENQSYRGLGSNRDWPWRKFHNYKSKPYKNVKENGGTTYADR